MACGAALQFSALSSASLGSSNPPALGAGPAAALTLGAPGTGALSPPAPWPAALAALHTAAQKGLQLRFVPFQVSRQQESASTGLEQLRQESSRQGLALAKVSEEKEVLVQEKAALELRLAAVERDRQGLSEQLAEARPVKETLARSLFEAQQRVSQLEIARSHLEMRLHTVTQAKDVIQGEVKCLQRELEAERSLLRQERENAAQQLLRRERQHDDALRLRQSDHEAETQRLLQDLQAAAEGEQLSWLSEKRRLSQRLECLQGAVARLELEKTELKQYNAELRRTLEQVERERRRLKRCCRGRSLPDACALSLSDQRKVPASRQVALLETQLVQEPK
ncbi:uncharacterized protein [Patagioenas fasciata]|uniref:uncharacterized protein n=1 Tax=Patagioenas fasciata TaxID=372321 RepID=UPI003A9A09F8